MKPAIVADVGNSRIKWGRCSASAVVDTAALPPDDRPTWAGQLAAWKLAPPLLWAVCGVAPQRRDALVDWLLGQGYRAVLVEDPGQLPLKVDVERPAAVGIDRLLNAVAANARRRANRPAIVVDAGSAVTVDEVTAEGCFSGGSIFPGLRLMSRSLHDYTALLPAVDVTEPAALPARSTMTAIQAGVFWAVVGGVRALVQGLIAHSEQVRGPARGFDVFLTGGDAIFLEATLRPSLLALSGSLTLEVWPSMTLEGLRLAAEAQS